MNNSIPLIKVLKTLPCSFLSSIQVFLDFDIIFSFFTTQGLYKSTIHKSALLPTERLPLSIFKILAGLDVKHSISLFNFTEPLWYNSSTRGSNVSIPEAPVAACEKVYLFDSSSSGL